MSTETMIAEAAPERPDVEPATFEPAVAERPAVERSTEPVAAARPRNAFVPADAGMATAEYAIATLAACGFAALLVVILRSDEVRQLLVGIIQHALALGS